MTPSIHTPPSKPLTPQEIRTRLALVDDASRWIAKMVCARYWDRVVAIDTQALERFSSEDRELVGQILSYPMDGKSDARLFALACWCRIEHGLTQWADRT